MAEAYACGVVLWPPLCHHNDITLYHHRAGQMTQADLNSFLRMIGTGIGVGVLSLVGVELYGYLKSYYWQQVKAEKKSLLPRNTKLNTHELTLFNEHLILADDMQVSMSDVGGLDEVKKALLDFIILPLGFPTLYNEIPMGLRMPKGVLFYGPPGCGKTMLAKAVAKECQARFIHVTAATLNDKWVSPISSGLCIHGRGRVGERGRGRSISTLIHPHSSPLIPTHPCTSMHIPLSFWLAR